MKKEKPVKEKKEKAAGRAARKTKAEKKAELADKKARKEKTAARAKAAATPRQRSRAADAPETKRMTSIVRRLHFREIRLRLGAIFGQAVLLFVFLSLGWFLVTEWTLTGQISSDVSRRILHGTDTLYYYIADASGKQLVRASMREPFIIILIVAAALIVLGLLGLLLSLHRDDKAIRKILAPINALAIKADELNRLSFSEDKYQLIEDAITRIQPSESEALSFGDSDLQGIETAVNNLLWRMRESNKQQARFVNDASHELRTPIAVIKGYSDLLARWGKTDEKILDESISAIQNESDHMNHLVEQLLFLARGDSGRTRLSEELVSLNEMVQEIYEESFMIDENHLYRYQPPENEILFTCDPGLLKQAVRILIDNAAKYTAQGDEIILRAGRNQAGSVYIEVQDTGIGMAEQDVQHMFERFYRSDNARNYAGTGLGLSIAKWIVDKHKGHFEILSRTQLGTRIRIVLGA